LTPQNLKNLARLIPSPQILKDQQTVLIPLVDNRDPQLIHSAGIFTKFVTEEAYFLMKKADFNKAGFNKSF